MWWGEDQPAPVALIQARGRPRTRLVRDATHRPISVKALVEALPQSSYRTLTWREGTKGWLGSRFARVRSVLRRYQLQATLPERAVTGIHGNS